MKSAELKYLTQQQELLATANALAAFRIYCLDRPVMVETDHKSLEAEYQPVFAYLSGAKNGIADALSRRSDLKPETKEFHDLLVPSFSETSYQLSVTEVTPTDNLIKNIVAGYAQDKTINEIKRANTKRGTASRSGGVSEKQYKPYFEENNLVWY
ncbi:hypothetical protein PC122_g24165 [Phytophthora cactorum]|nr:hypothetical protein PC122_g24165 [Phytophthora cactorum]